MITMGIKEYEEIEESLAQTKGTIAGQMFGKRCIKTLENRAFAVWFQDEMVFKLGREEIAQIQSKYTGSQLFDPSGKKRPMKDWLQVPAEFSDDWATLAKQALEFVEG